MLTVATWNLENLFRPGEEGGPSSQEAYEAKLTALADTINEVKPDVLGVQEVGSPAALEDLRDRLDGEWERPVFGEPGDRPIRVAFLSRHPLLDVTGVRTFPAGTDPVKTEDDGTLTSAMSRGALHVRVSAGATDVELVVCHLKSKLLHFPSLPGYPSGGFSTRDEGVRALRRLRAGAARRRSDHHPRARYQAPGRPFATYVVAERLAGQLLQHEPAC